MDEKYFYELIELRRSETAWKRLSNGYFQLTNTIIENLPDKDFNKVKLTSKSKCSFKLKVTRDPNPIEDKYILIGRGWID
jgi:hypothetical protein